MTGFSDQEFDSEEEFLLEALNDNYRRHYIVDINYNRPLKNFPSTLNKIEEVDETSVSVRSSEVKDENGNPILEEEKEEVKIVTKNEQAELVSKFNDKKKVKQRPKSASCAFDLTQKKKEEQNGKRPLSSCANYPSRIPISKEKCKKRSDSESSSLLSQGFERSQSRKNKHSHSSWERLYYEEDGHSIGEYPERSTCPCCMRPPEHYELRDYGIKRSKSQPNISRRRPCSQEVTSPQDAWCEVSKFKRSLRLLGLSSSDFGLPESPKISRQLPPRPRSSHNSAPTFSTKVMERSISLDSLREIVRESTYNKYAGLPQRKLLAQAAYEEWYFKKEELSVRISQSQQKLERKKQKIIEEDTRRRQEQAGEKFQEWLDSKRKQDRNRKGTKLKLNENLNCRLIKSKEEIDKAYLEWKKKKQKGLDDKKLKKQQEVEKEEKERADKEEKKRLAEKVFQDWKKKLEENEKERRQKEEAAKEKFKEAVTTRSMKTNKSFKVWKELKEDEIKARWRNARNAAKQAEAKRTMQLTERMYEAEEAFEEWLDKVDHRKQKLQKSKIPKPVAPWAPA